MLQAATFRVLPQLRDREVLGSFCTQGQGLYPLQHILGKSQLEQGKKGQNAASVQTEVKTLQHKGKLEKLEG